MRLTLAMSGASSYIAVHTAGSVRRGREADTGRAQRQLDRSVGRRPVRIAWDSLSLGIDPAMDFEQIAVAMSTRELRLFAVCPVEHRGRTGGSE